MSFSICNYFYFGKGVGVRSGEMERTYSAIYFMVQEYIRGGPFRRRLVYLFEVNAIVSSF